MNFLRLMKMLILRNMREEKFLTFLSVLGIALGIGLFTGVKIAADRAIASFESDINGINPSANYEVFDPSGTDFDEGIYQDVRSIEENSFPVLKTFGYIPALRDSIDITGIFTVKAIRFLKIPQNSSGNQTGTDRSKDDCEFAGKTFELEKFYREENGILVTRRFAERYSLSKGDTLKVLVYDKEYALSVVDIINAEALLSNAVFMDLGNFQEHFGKTGSLSKIDLVSDEKTAYDIRKKLPFHLRLEKKDEIFRNQKSLIASFRYNLQFISLIAILVGIFLLYNTVFISVVKRRTEIGILRGLGAGRKTVILLFTLQGIILGFIGSLLGIMLGQVAAYFSVIAVERTITTMYGTISISEYAVTPYDAAVALLLGLLVSLLASFLPAYEASKIRPHETSREGSFEGRYRKYYKMVSFAGIVFIFVGTGLSYVDYRYTPFPFPVFAYIGILFIIGGFTFFAPLYLDLALRFMRKPLEKLFRATGKITLGDMKGNIYRFSVALMSVAISSALIIALLMLIFSFRNSLKGWINKTITADVYIKPASCRANYCFYPLSGQVVEAVKSYPEVEGVDEFRGIQLDLYGKKVTAGFADIQIKRKFLHRRHTDSEYEETLKEMEGDEQVAGISDYLSQKYGLQKGDKITLLSQNGKVTFRINDVFSSYATTSGFVYLDRKWLKKYWGLDDATQISVYLKPDADAQQVIQKLKARLLPDYALEIMNNQELRKKILDIFNKSFSITYAIEFISIIVSIIGVINTLLALVFERKREISIIRYLGGTWKQIQQNLILSAGLIGVTGIFFGMLLGPLMSIILIHVINKISFGWEIHFQIPYLYLGAVTGILFLTTVLAGLLPANVARKIDPRRFVSFE